jgi:hypothetical protein
MALPEEIGDRMLVVGEAIADLPEDECNKILDTWIVIMEMRAQ